MMKRNILLVSISIFLLLVLTLAAVAAWQQPQSFLRNSISSDEQSEEPSPEVAETPIRASGGVEAACRLVPVHSAQLSFSTSGLIDSLLVEEGQNVEAGTLLARLDGQKKARAALVSAQRELAAAEEALTLLNENVYLRVAQALKQLRDAEIAEKDAQKNLNRSKDGNNSSAEIAQAEAGLGFVRANLQQARDTYDVIKNGVPADELTAAEMRIAEARANLDAAEEAEMERVLIAPFSGKVVQVYRVQGEFSAAGAPVLLLVDLDNYYVETTNLTELNVAAIHAGDPVKIVFDAMPEKNFDGEVDWIQPFGQKSQGDVVYMVRISGDFRDEGIYWGMTCSASIGE